MPEPVTQSIFGNRDLNKGEGWVQELQHLVDVAATQLVGHVKTTADAAGMPWGSSKISKQDALARLREFEDPARSVKFEQLSDQAIITAAIDAIRRRKEATANGEIDEIPMEMDGEPGTFRPATIQPGYVAGVTPTTPGIKVDPGAPAANIEAVPTSMPVQMGLPGMQPMKQ